MMIDTGKVRQAIDLIKEQFEKFCEGKVVNGCDRFFVDSSIRMAYYMLKDAEEVKNDNSADNSQGRVNQGAAQEPDRHLRDTAGGVVDHPGQDVQAG